MILLDITHDWIGSLHLWSAIIALISGSLIFVLPKADQRHRVIGYVYSIAMLLVFVTAFMIYRLFGGFGIFHIMAMIGFATLCAGLFPIWIYGKTELTIGLHFGFMYWSVAGLDAAFVSETMVRLPGVNFFDMLGWSNGLVLTIAGIIFFKFKDVWAQRFS